MRWVEGLGLTLKHKDTALTLYPEHKPLYIKQNSSQDPESKGIGFAVPY